jgi:hypothetical protein
MLCPGIALATPVMFAFKLLLRVCLGTPSALFCRRCVWHIVARTASLVCSWIVDFLIFNPPLSLSCIVRLCHGSNNGGCWVGCRRAGGHGQDVEKMDCCRVPIEFYDRSGRCHLSRTTAGSLTICIGPGDLLVSGSIIQFPRCDMLTAVFLSKKTWGEEGSLQAGVLRVRGTRCLSQRFIASMRIIDEHATLVELSKMCAFG